MKRQKSICTTLMTISLILALLMFVLATKAFITRSGQLEFFLVGFCLSAVVYAFADLWFDSIKEALSPLNYKTKAEALNFAYQTQTGTKQDFITKYSKELYQHFILQGYLLQFRKNSTDIWEISAKGRKKQRQVLENN